MRRLNFCLAIWVFAFAVCFGHQNVSAQTVSIKTSDNPNYVISCADKVLRSVWSNLKNEFVDVSTDYLKTIQLKNCRDLFEVGKVVDLNGDKKPEIIVHQIGIDCPASGNCTFWVFQKNKANNFKSILDGNEIQTFDLKKTKTNGYTDVELRTHNSAASHYYQLFKFNGKKYTAQRCWWEDFMIPDKKGNFHEVKKPQIRFEKCGEYDYVK